LVGASNGESSPSSGFPSCFRPQRPASHSNSSQQLNRSGYLSNYRARERERGGGGGGEEEEEEEEGRKNNKKEERKKVVK
jgi:hypothetical protein